MSDLYCHHADGRAELLDGLSNGTLVPAQQVHLWALLNPLSDLPEFFRESEVFNYRAEPAGDDTIIESWYCPICSAFHSDTRELEINS